MTDTEAAWRKPSTSSELCLSSAIQIHGQDNKYRSIVSSFGKIWTDEWIYRKDTICPTHVVAMARAERTEPTKLRLRSVTEAMPTPSRRTSKDNLMLWLQTNSYLGVLQLSVKKKKKKKKQLNLKVLLRNRVSSRTVKGMMASLVIWYISKDTEPLFHIINVM